jgi:hypothetical protein
MTAWWLIVAAIVGTTGAEPGTGVEVSSLIAGLTAPRRADRTRAEKRLEALGDAARPALLRAIESRDLRLKARAAVVLDAIEGRDLAVPKRVALNFRNATLTDVIDAISDRTGEGLILQADNNLRRGDMVITLVAEEKVSFWEAVERLSKVASLQVDQNPNPGWNNRAMIGGFNNAAPRIRRPATGQEVVLVPNTGFLPSPTAVSGRFEVAVMNIHHQRDRTLGASGRKPTRDTTLDRFEIRLRVSPEPNLIIGKLGEVEGLEAVDDQGQSLVPDSQSVVSDPNQPTAVHNFQYQGPWRGPASIVLRYPERPGTTIRTLKGAFAVTVVGAKPNGAAASLVTALGVPVQKGGVTLTVHSMKVAGAGQVNSTARTVELTLNRPDATGQPNHGMPSFNRTVNVIPAMAQGALQFVDAKGRQVERIVLTPYNMGDGQRRTLQINPPPGSDPPVEVRYLAPAWAALSVPFEFHDLPMP